MADTIQRQRDWAAGKWSLSLIWVTPKLAIVAGLFLAVPARTAIWTAALAWMGVACLLNSRRCGRVHCRYTGPFYLCLIVPVLLLGSGVVQAGIFAWLVVGTLGVFGGFLIAFATEATKGRYEDLPK